MVAPSFPPAVMFLFTDIEGSSRAWERAPEAMNSALRDHNRIVADAVAQHGGRVFKTVGDEFCCAFLEPARALRAAIEIQLGLAAAPWPKQIGELRVRIALHAGTALSRDGDYFGPTVNRTARLLSIGHGGQILVSSSAKAALSSALPEGVTFLDLGSHRLKDLKQAQETFQVIAPGLGREFPALASLDAHPNNLPTQLSSFVGRAEDIAHIRDALRANRVLTIAGPGGVGKTRLALQVGAESVGDFAGGVYFVPLAPLTRGDLIWHALASALSVGELRSEPLSATVMRFIENKRMLLIFDNSEHVLGELAAVVKEALSSSPELRCLVTGREPVHLTGEIVERLSPLETPSNAASVAELERHEASLLFLERARAVSPASLQFSPADCSLIVDICRRLDGIPLAIELAASRLATMPLPRLAERLGSSLLVNKDPTAESRHRTLRDAIRWSYRLLEPQEQRVFTGLSVFRGGCTIEAVESVVDDDADDVLSSLVDKSLVQLDLSDGRDARYRLLEPIAEFAASVDSHAASRERLAQRHFDFYAGLSAATLGADGDVDKSTLVRIDLEIDNLRAALHWALRSDSSRAARLALTLAPYWRARGSFTEGRAWFDRLLDAGGVVEPSLRAGLLRQSAAFAATQDDYARSMELATSALREYRELGDAYGVGSALHILGELAHRQGRLDEAADLYAETYRHLEPTEHRLAKAICLMNQALIARQRGEYERAKELLTQANANAERLRDRSIWAVVHIERGWVSLASGDADGAEAIFQDSFAVTKEERDAHGVCRARLGIATAALSAGRVQTALPQYDEALREAVALRGQIFAVDAIYGLAAVCALRGDLMAAAKCCGLAAQIVDRIGCEPRTGVAYTIAMDRIRAGLSDDRCDAAMRAGARLTVEEAAALGRLTPAPSA